MTEIMPVPRNLILLSYQQGAYVMPLFFGAGDEARTRYLHLGKVALYQMSYARGTRCTIPDIFRFVKHRF